MQIIQLKIDDYNCLLDFDINFKTTDSGSSTILIGENGTGKSSMLEVILRILSSFDSPIVAKEKMFNFYLKYKYANETIVFQKQDNQYAIVCSDYHIYGSLDTVRNKLKEDQKNIFPKRVVIFYSGYQNNLLPVYKTVDKRYASICRKTVNKYTDYISANRITERFEIDFPDKKYNYCYENLTSIYLSSVLLDNSAETYEKKILMNDCHFEKIEKIDVILNLKKLSHLFQDDVNSQEAPELFWEILSFIEGSLVDLYRGSFLYRNKDKIHFSLSNFVDFNLDRISIFNAFEKLSTLFDSKYDVTVKYGASDVQVSKMSEGQQQLIRILGMLGLYKNEDCLVIMDEPDAHMNPKWKYDLKSIIDECLKDATNTQALIATHDPLVINGVDKDFVKIFNYELVDGFYRTKINNPTEDTKGMGIDGLLQSEYYGLQTSYDKDTSVKFLRRQALYIKLINDEINGAEKEELRALTKELGSLPFSNNTIDFLYDDFIKEYRQSEYYTKEYLTFDEVVARRSRIKEIINRLFEEN